MISGQADLSRRIRPRRVSPHHRLWSLRKELAVTAFFFFFGWLYLFAVPPGVCWDEFQHFARTLAISSGELLPKKVAGKITSPNYPEAVCPFKSELETLTKQKPMMRRQDLARLHRQVWEPAPVMNWDYKGTIPSCFLSYLPQTVGIGIGRAWHRSLFDLYYLGRAANLIFCTIVLFVSLCLMPVQRKAFALLALSPLTLCLCASDSPDGSYVVLGFLTIAYCCYLAVRGSGRVLTRSELAVLFLVIAVLSFSKFIYATTVLLFLLIPASALGSRRRYLLVFSLLVAFAAMAGALYVIPSKQVLPFRHNYPGYSCCPSEQLAFVKQHPQRFIHYCLETLARDGRLFFWRLRANCPAYYNEHAHYLYFAVFLGLAMSEGRRGPLNRWKPRCIAFLVLALMTGILFLTMYLWWTPVGARYVEGIHGRYFLPLLPLLVLTIGCNRLVLSESTRTILTITAPLYINLVALATLLETYFVTRRAFLLSSAFLVCCLPLLIFGLPLLIRAGLRGPWPSSVNRLLTVKKPDGAL
ncbi:MAG: DUF2142 domain-containing protein [Gemmataceae bacterium]